MHITELTAALLSATDQIKYAHDKDIEREEARLKDLQASLEFVQNAKNLALTALESSYAPLIQHVNEIISEQAALLSAMRGKDE